MQSVSWRRGAAMALALGMAGAPCLERVPLTLATCAGYWGAAGALLLMPVACGEAAGVAATALAGALIMKRVQ